MERLELAATRRTLQKGAAKRLRQQGQVPAILYGRNVENEFLQVDALDFKRILAQGGGGQLLHLKIEDAPSARPVLVREIQRDIFSGAPTHVDFMVISLTDKITASIVINLVGESIGVSRSMGILLQGANTIEVECLPGDLMPSLEVDVSALDLNQALYVGDLSVPDEFAVLSDPQEMVAQVVPERLAEVVEEEEEGLFVGESPEVEVITRERDEEA